MIIANATAAAAAARSAIVLAEDKKYYPAAEEVYPDSEILVQDEDTQPITQPIVAPLKSRVFSLLEVTPPSTVASPAFLAGLMSSPHLIRNVALAGHLHHGKTTLCDVLVEAAHTEPWDPEVAGSVRYTDCRLDEQARGLSIKCTPLSLVLPSSLGKSHLLHLVDTPGHVNFCDEVAAAFRAVDGVLLVVDAVEGVMLSTERAVKAALRDGLRIVLVLSKVDRLITELKLPPTDAYFKLLHIIGEVNTLLSTGGGRGGAPPHPVLSPITGNGRFSGAAEGWIFSLSSFSRLYCDRVWPGAGVQSSSVDPSAFAARLWGDVYYDPTTRRFSSRPGGGPRTFVQFVLEPLYKVYACVVGEEPAALGAILQAELGIRLTPDTLSMNPRPLLRVILRQVLGDGASLVDAVLAHLPSPAVATAAKAASTYTGSPDRPEALSMAACDPRGPLMVNIVKLFSSPDAKSFLAWGRVLSGTLNVGDSVRILGEHYSWEDGEDMALRTVRSVAVGQARFSQEVTSAPAGNLVLLGGLDDVIGHAATLTGGSESTVSGVSIFRPLYFDNLACVHISVEPLRPSELPKVLAGLRALTKSYPLAGTRVEESGEHVLMATGELALDCMLHDLRTMYAEVEVRVSDPVTGFAETVLEASSIKCFASSPNTKNRLTFLAEPLDKGLPAAIEAGVVPPLTDKKAASDYFRSNYGWDVLAARSVWAFGPGVRGGRRGGVCGGFRVSCHPCLTPPFLSGTRPQRLAR